MFAKGQKVWTPEFGWVKYERALIATPDTSYDSKLRKIQTSTIQFDAPEVVVRLTREERYSARLRHIQLSSTAYEFAGWVASHNGLLHVSTPPKDLEKVESILADHKVEYVVGTTLTISTDSTAGWSISVVVESSGANLEAAGIHATPYFETGKVSTQTRQFCLDFLLDDLRFKLGSIQDIALIRSRIPEAFRADFERGFLGNEQAL
jgi:hypothetical protein